MHTYASIVVAVAALQGALASPKPTTTFLGTLPGDDKPCSTPAATVTTTLAHVVCEGPVCLLPTSVCSAGEPTGPAPRAPTTATVAPSGACTATVEVIDIPGCGNCATCTSAPALRGRHTKMPGQHQCVPTTTAYETVGPQSTEICACPLIRTSCSSGQPTVKPLPTTTLVEGCTESVVVGPGDCSNICVTCS